MVREVMLTRQRRITIPKPVCQALHLAGGDHLEIVVMPGHRLLLKPSKAAGAGTRVSRLGREILEAERQIKSGHVVPWHEVKRRHGL